MRKHVHGRDVAHVLYSASMRVAPSAKPSKVWWSTKAAARGRMVQWLGETPSAMPISTLQDTCGNANQHKQSYIYRYEWFHLSK